MTEREARRLCLLEMADMLAREALQTPVLWARRDAQGQRLTETGRTHMTKAAMALVQQWRDEAAALGEDP